MTTEEITIIRRYYAGTVEALDEAEKAYNSDKKSVKKREIFQYVAAQEAALSDLCAELGVELYDDDLNLIEEA